MPWTHTTPPLFLFSSGQRYPLSYFPHYLKLLVYTTEGGYWFASFPFPFPDVHAKGRAFSSDHLILTYLTLAVVTHLPFYVFVHPFSTTISRCRRLSLPTWTCPPSSLSEWVDLFPSKGDRAELKGGIYILHHCFQFDRFRCLLPSKKDWFRVLLTASLFVVSMKTEYVADQIVDVGY